MAREAWVEARKRSEFPLFDSALAKILDLNRRMADHWGFEECRYDALLEGYERGARASDIRKLFAELRPAIVSVLGPAVDRSKSVPADTLDGDYPLAAQQAFNREVAEAIGFDFGAGRIDTTAHPFCTGLGPGDCRSHHARTTSATSPNPFTAFCMKPGTACMTRASRRTITARPPATAVSLGIHESQSRLWENHVGRGPEFWEHWLPQACRHFPILTKFTPEQVTRAVNRVAPSFDPRGRRTRSPTTCTSFCVFEIELKLIEGELNVAGRARVVERGIRKDVRSQSAG